MNKFGGIVGSNILNILSSSLGSIGTLIFLVILVIPATSLSFNFSWINTIDQIGIIIVKLSKFILDQIKSILSYIKKIIILFFSSLKKIVLSLQENNKTIKKAKKSNPKINNESYKKMSMQVKYKSS